MTEDQIVREFTVVARSASGCVFSPDGHFILRDLPTATGNVTLTLRTRRTQAKGFSKPLPRGLWVEIKGPAPDLRTALNTFGQAAQNILPVLVIVTNAPTEDLTPELGFETTTGVLERDFFQQFLLDERLLPFERRAVPCELLSAVFRGMSQALEHERIHRALGYYQHALTNWSFGKEIACLSYIYMGMEAMTRVALSRLLNARGTSREDLLKEWGITIKQLDSEVRRRILFQGDAALYREVKKASDGLEHGFLPFPKIRDTALRHRETAARYLREAILESLALDEAIIAKLTQPPLDRPFSIRFTKYVWGKIIGEAADLAAPDQYYPILKWYSSPFEEKSDDGQDPKIGFNEKFTPQLADKVGFKAERYEVWGDRHDHDDDT